MKRNIVCVVAILLAAMIISGCGGGAESYINVLSTDTKSVLTTKTLVYGGKYAYDEYYNFTLTDSSKIFLTVKLLVKSSSNNITINMRDIVVVSDDSERSLPVSFRFSSEYWGYVFTWGDSRMAFGPNRLDMYDCVFKWDSSNNSSLSCEEYTLESMSIADLISGFEENPFINLAFIVSKASVDSGSLWLEIPNSPLIALEVPKIE